MAFLIQEVQPGSPAQKAGIRPGQMLKSINGHAIKDVLDYRFYGAQRRLTLGLIDRNGKEFEKVIKKQEYDDLGLEFETYLMDKPMHCHNHCVFCFIDQLPKGLRQTLYFKDDDTRLSFLTGNYVTLTNVKEQDIWRIIDQRISPINISIHTTDMDLRVKMLSNPAAAGLLNYIQLLYQARIPMNAQLVICPGLNDGEQLKKSMQDLKKFAPHLQSVSVVPVGLTKHRQGLYQLTAFDQQSAERLLDLVEQYGEQCKKELGTRLFFAADEFYIKAKREIPPASFYEEFLQIENGVGMLASMRDTFYNALQGTQDVAFLNGEISIITGVAAYEFICSLVDEITKRWHTLKVNVYSVQNDFLGQSITVSGLLCGCDILAQLKGKSLGKKVCFPGNMLKSGTDILLDDVTTRDLEQALGVPFVAIDSDGYEFFDLFLDMDRT